MTILVDMDDVLEQLLDAMIRYNNARYGSCTTLEDVREWDLTKAFPTLTPEQAYSSEFDKSFWKSVKPMPGADEALRTLLARGHEIYVVTASIYQTIPEKLDDVLFRYFPYIDEAHVIITSRKQMIRGDILVDDGPHNFPGGDYYKILFDAPHNRSFDESTVGAVRVKNWQEALEAIERYEQQRRRSGAAQV